jgi:hypothetical protein
VTEENAKSHNPFSKIVGDLRTSKEALVKKNEEEYQDRLEQAEEILVGDCHDALAGITAQAFMKSGKVSFESETFLWFKDDKKTLMGVAEPNPAIKVEKSIAESIRRKKNKPKEPFNPYRSSGKISLGSQGSKKLDEASFIGPKQIMFVNSDLHEIYRKVRKQLSEENFVLETNDGIKFTLLWSSG